jgi:putative transposase
MGTGCDDGAELALGDPGEDGGGGAELALGDPGEDGGGGAEPALGDPGGVGGGDAELALDPTHRGWYSRGYLPHCDYPGLLQSITYRLADSLPVSALERMEAELHLLPERQRDVERRRLIEEWLDAGHGCCVLRWPEAAACVVENWQHFAGERYDLIAWVVMPNHVHLLIRVYEGVSLGKIVQSWKSYTGRRIRAMLDEGRAGARRSQAGRSQAGRASEALADGVWMREYWDRYIRDERHFEAVVGYVHDNPVKAGLVDKAENWPWSSAREFAELAELALGDPGEDGAGGAELALGDPRSGGAERLLGRAGE